MKTYTSLFVCAWMILSVVQSFATIRTVSNDPSHPAQYPSIQSALDAAVAGDTIYVHGSSFTYDDFTIRKRVALIGAGYNPINQFNQPTRVNNGSLFRDAGSSDASGSVITGFYFLGNFGIAGGSLPITNITFSRNRLDYIMSVYVGSTFCDQWLICNNIIKYLWGGGNGPTTPSSTNFTILNNIFTGNIANFSSSSIIVDHNLFLNSGNLSGMYYTVFSNNLFIRSSGDVFSQVIYCAFSNNLSSQSTIGAAGTYTPTNSFISTYLGAGGGANTGAGNFVGVDPLIQNISDLNNYSQFADYHLKAGSPGKNASTDGTDLGIYGGSYPFPSGGASGSGFETSPTPPIPQVTQVDIQNATIAPNGTLQVKVQAKVNN
jgi:hypothetical protein